MKILISELTNNFESNHSGKFYMPKAWHLTLVPPGVLLLDVPEEEKKLTH